MHTKRMRGTRAPVLAGLALAMAATLASCASTPDRVVIPVQQVQLGNLVDELVEFTSTLQGPGPQGDFITIGGEPVYLDDLHAPERYGQQVSVSGRLRYFIPPKAGDCGSHCDNVDVPRHYWIENAKFAATVTPAQ